MAVLSDITFGTINLAAGSTAVTGTGTLFQSAQLKEGDTLQIQNLTAVIASVNSNTSLTLTEPWTGTSLTDAPFRARFLPDGSRQTSRSTTLIELLSNGVLSNLAELGVEDGKTPVGNAAGDYELKSTSGFGLQDPTGTLAKFAALTVAARQIFQTDENGAMKALALLANKFIYTDANKDLAQGDITPWAISMLGLTGTADRMPYLSAANSSALTPLTAFARSILDDGDAATVRGTIGALNKAGESGLTGTYVWSKPIAAGVFALNLGEVDNAGPSGGGYSRNIRYGNSGVFSATSWFEIQHGLWHGLTTAITNASGTPSVFFNFRGNGSAYANSGSWVNSSDGRLKTDIKNIPDPLEALKKLNGCTWTRIDTGTNGIGLIAQDAEKAVPGCSQISEKEKTLPDGTTITDVLALDTGGVAAAVLVEATKAMLVRIEVLEGLLASNGTTLP